MDNDAVEIKHPSYGLVQISRRQGNPKLFGSALDNHMHYVTVSIRRATLIREKDHDRYYGSMRGDLIEIDLSAAQFAEMLTTMNVGMGVPCTISYVNNERVDPPPTIPNQTEAIKTGFAKTLRDFAKKSAQDVLSIRQTLKKKSLGAADRAQILGFLDKMTQELTSNVPYFVEMFREATEKLETAAKSEIDAFMTTIVQQAGLKALQSGDIKLPQLGEKK